MPRAAYRSVETVCPICGHPLSGRSLRRHELFGCPHRMRISRYRHLLRLEANRHGEVTTVSRVLLLLENAIQTPLSTLQSEDVDDPATTSISTAMAQLEISGGASPMDLSPPPDYSAAISDN